MMAELIDRAALLEKLKECAQYHSSDTYIGNIYDAIDEIEAAPTVDAVKVVRCKDCKYWAHGDCYRIELSRPNDFCSYGERREDNAPD